MEKYFEINGDAIEFLILNSKSKEKLVNMVDMINYLVNN